MNETIKTIITADGSAHAAAFRAAAETVNGYYAKERAAASKAVDTVQAQIAALRMQAGGYENLANSMRASQALQEQAARMAASGAITEQKALGLLRERQRLEQNIATQRARSARIASPREIGLPGGQNALPPLTPVMLRQIDRTTATQREMRRQMYQTKKATDRGAMGFLALTQAVEDAQYGMQGVINNIPQMVMGFGGTTGLAGTLSLAAVGGYAAYKAMYRLAADPKITDWADRQAAGQKAYNSELERGKEEIRRYAMEERVAADIAERRQVENRNIEKTLELDRYRLQILDGERERLERIRKAQDMILESRVKAGLLSVGGASEFANRLEQRRAMDDIASSQANINKLSAEHSRIWGNIGSNLTRYQQDRGKIGENLEKDMQSLAWMTAEKARLQTMLENPEKALPGEINRMRFELEDLNKLIAKTEEQLRLNEEKQKLMDEMIIKTRQEGDESKRIILEKIDSEKKRIAMLKEQLALQEMLRKNQESSQAAEYFKAWQNAKAKSAETATLSREDGRALQEAAKMDPSQKSARAAYVEEVMILQQILLGNRQKAKLAEDHLNLQQQAVDKAKEWNVSQQLALQLLRQKKALTEQVEGYSKGLPQRAEARAMARQEAREERKRAARALNDRENPLRPELLRSKEEERRNRGLRDRMIQQQRGDKPKPIEERQITLIEEIAGALKRLGLV